MARRTILWSTWESSLDNSASLSSGGGGSWSKFLFKALNEHDYNVHWTTANDPKWKQTFESMKKFDINMAIFCWRWKFPDEPHFASRNMAYERQNAWINYCITNKIPFIVHDQDLKMLNSERAFITDNGGEIYTPSLFPAKGEGALHFPNPYHMRKPTYWSANQLIYVGNNYERMEQFTRLLQGFSSHVSTRVFGNWLEPSNTRLSPERLKEAFPHIIFGERLNQDVVIDLLFNSRATVMLHKPEYGPRGFMTLRYAEAAAAGTVPFIPAEFILPSTYMTMFDEIRVHNSEEMTDKYMALTPKRRIEISEAFVTFVSKYQTFQPWLDIIERLAR